MVGSLKSVQFPLLSTDASVLKEVIRCMDVLELINFSVLSKRTKSFVDAKSVQFPLLSIPRNSLKEVLRSMNLLDLVNFSLISKKSKFLADIKSVQFPLLSIPSNAITKVLKTMDFAYLIRLSLVSKKMKSLAVELDFKPMPVDVYTMNSMRIYVDHRNHPLGDFTRITDPVTYAIFLRSGSKTESFDLRTFEHALLLAKQKTVRRLLFRENLDETFLPIVFYYFPTCENVTIYPNVSESAQRKIISQYRTTTKQFSLYSIPSEDCRRELTMRNLDYLRINLTLESLLSANSATLWCCNLDMKILNRFLKLWIRSKSNSRLEYFYTYILDQVEEKVQTLLAGIDYEEVPADTIRIFKHSKKAIASNVDWRTMTDTMEVRGGYDFKRRDRTGATITVREHNTRMRLEIFIWH